MGIIMGFNGEGSSDYPKYYQIAVEFAIRIVSGEYNVGDRIFARSSLASQYGVSAETARRAICVLSDLGIVISEKGSGVTIKSYEYAEKFVKQQSKRQSIDNIKDNIMKSIELQRKEFDSLNKNLSELVNATEHFRSFNPFVPFQILIKSNCLHLNKNINEINFWQNTGATIIAVRRDEKIMLSPGPYLQLLENDIIYYITQDAGPGSVTKFLFNIK